MDAELQTALDRTRSYAASVDKISWTSLKYQDDLIAFIGSNRDKGNCVVEVGCFRGGLSVLLATVCKELGVHLHTMDIDPAAVASTQTIIDDLGLTKHATVHLSELSGFVRPAWFANASTRRLRAIICILDGDHTYDAVRRDLKSIERLKTHAIGFHDYCLRHPEFDERVDDAVRDHFGHGAKPSPIGLLMTGAGHPTKQNPQPDGHYWKVPGSEGALLTLG